MNIESFDTNTDLFVTKSLNNDKDEEIGETVRNYFLGNSSAKNATRFSKVWPEKRAHDICVNCIQSD